MYFSRLIENKILKLSAYFKVLLIVGARQVGKSTILKHLYPNCANYVFDPVTDHWNARHDPNLFLQNLKPPIILDEIQYSAEILPGLKRLVDSYETKGLFFLTGSQNFSMLKHASESLAGRVSIIELKGLTPYERTQNTPWLQQLLESPDMLFQTFFGCLKLKNTLYELILQGGLPETALMPFDILGNYHSSYIRTYLERDIRLLENIRDLSDFERFIALMSALTAQEVNYTHLGRELGISPLTARRWLDALEHGYQWLSIPGFYKNTIKRISQKPKGHFSDTGIACHLIGITSAESLAKHPMLGNLFESYCINMIDAMNQGLDHPAKMYHFRTQNGAEVDLILERDGCCIPIEIKCKTQITSRDTRGILSFMDTYPDISVPLGIILYAGTECYFVHNKILVMPWCAIFSNQAIR